MAIKDWVLANLGLLLTVGCALLAAWQLSCVALAMSTRYWRVVPGTIYQLEYRELDEAGRTAPQVCYRYELAGRVFIGRRIWLSRRTFTDYSRMVDSLGPILPGSVHPVRVLAFAPRLAVLVPGTTTVEVSVLVILFGATIASAHWLA